MADGGQEHVAARLVGLRLEREPKGVALVDGVLAEDVEGFLEAVEGSREILRRIDLGALAAAPEDVGLGAQLGRQVEVAHDLAQREAADVTIVGGEGAVLEDRVAEQVRGEHGRDHAGLLEGLLEAPDVLRARGIVRAEGDEVVVVEGDAPGAQLGQAIDGLDGVHVRPGGVTEGIAGLPPDGPEAEAELVGGCGLVVGHRSSSSSRRPPSGRRSIVRRFVAPS